jgi:hypothetical protein
MIVVPFIAFIVSKWATYGYYSGKKMWEEPKEPEKKKE